MVGTVIIWIVFILIYPTYYIIKNVCKSRLFDPVSFCNNKDLLALLNNEAVSLKLSKQIYFYRNTEEEKIANNILELCREKMIDSYFCKGLKTKYKIVSCSSELYFICYLLSFLWEKEKHSYIRINDESFCITTLGNDNKLTEQGIVFYKLRYIALAYMVDVYKDKPKQVSYLNHYKDKLQIAENILKQNNVFDE